MMWVFVAWNLFLAAVPVVLGSMAGRLLRRDDRRWWVQLSVAVLLLAWLVFLPNTCYLLTEWRHLLFDERWESLLDRAPADRTAMLKVAAWALAFLAYSGVGVLAFVVSIRPVEQALRARGQGSFPLLWAPSFFVLMSLGVYLGLIERFNTWDLLRHPQVIWTSAWWALTQVPLLSAVLVFAAVLWVVYEAVDLWIDALILRLNFHFDRSSGGSSAIGRIPINST